MRPSVRVRRARPEDRERVREVRLRALAGEPDAFGSTLEREQGFGLDDRTAWITGWEGAANALFLAETDGETIGMAVGSREGAEPEAHLYGMWVEPAWRGRGVGRVLVDEVLGWARSWGASSVVLAVTETNEGAARFYERLGFGGTGERHPLRDGRDLWVRVLRRDLG